MKLYHGSPKNDLKQLTPQKTLSLDKYIGDFVFATKNKVLAIMYLANKGVATLMNAESESPYIVICAEANEYIKNDIGGALYKVSSKTFKKTPQAGLENYEVVSEEAVETETESVYSTSLEAFKNNKIAVYFVDQKTLDELIGNPKQDEMIIELPLYKL